LTRHPPAPPVASSRGLLGEVSGAFADLGTFLPIVLGVVSLNRMDPTGVLIGFGLFALATAAVYRRPVPVQPMKVVAAIAIASQLPPSAIAASGVLIAIVLLVIGLGGWIDRLASWVPKALWKGVQLGVGLYLIWSGLRLMQTHWLLGGALLAMLWLSQRTPLKSYAVPLLLAVLAVYAFRDPAGLPAIHVGFYLPQPVDIGWPDLWRASAEVLLPQLALTLTNAVIVTSAIAREYFPQDSARISPRRLALSTGAFNLLLSPFGAFPMCHGAGGLVVQHRFGARTGLAPALFGAGCLALGLLLGPDALKLLERIPVAALGALLAVAGIALAADRSLLRAKSGERAVILLTGVSCVILNVALGLLIGWLAEWLRRRLARTE